MPENKQLLISKLNKETAKISWHELQRFYAQGRVLYVADQLDLIDVAYQFAVDNVEQCLFWKEQKLVTAVTDLQASDWYQSEKLLWAVVVAPWVLVQLPHTTS